MNRREFVVNSLSYLPFLVTTPYLYGQAFSFSDVASSRIHNDMPPDTSSYVYYATQFDKATPDYLVKTGTITGSDSKTCIFSTWVKLTGTDGVANRFIGNLSSDVLLQRLASNAVRIATYNTDGVTVALTMTSTGTIISDGVWHHVLINMDSSNATNCWIAIDGTAGTTIDTRNDVTAKFAASYWNVGYETSGVALDAALSEFYFAPGQTLGAFSSANVLKFRTVYSKPADLGVSGSTPTGNPPAVYFHSGSSDFGINFGTGGNFTVGGTLTSATKP